MHDGFMLLISIAHGAPDASVLQAVYERHEPLLAANTRLPMVELSGDEWEIVAAGVFLVVANSADWDEKIPDLPGLSK